MNRTRKKPYYYINDIGEIKYDVDNRSERDTARFKIGNYFTDPGKARDAQQAFFRALGTKTGLINRIKAMLL